MRVTLPELASELSTTDRTLRRAVLDGLVRAHRPSPRAVDLPLSERVYLRNAWPLLRELRSALRTEPSLRLAVLFGSQSRGDSHGSSDVDLLVDASEAAPLRDVRRRLEARLGRQVHLVGLRDAELAPLLLAEVLREGRVLVDRERNWPTLLERRVQVEREAERERSRIDDEFAAAFFEHPA
jgi:predicted nucleotidyltransferase